MALPRQYTLYPGAYAPIPLPSIAVPTAIPASKLYDDLGVEVESLAKFADIAGGDGIGAEGTGTGTGAGTASSQGIGVGLGSSIGSSIGGMVGGPMGSVAGSAIGGAMGVGAQGNQGAAAASSAAQAAIGLGLSALGVPGLAVAAISSLVSNEDVAEALGLQANSTIGFGFSDIGQGIGPGVGVGTGVGVGMGNDGAAPGMGDATGSGIGVGPGGGIGGDNGSDAGAPGMGGSMGSGVSGSVGAGSVGDGSGSSGSSKIICTAMNAAYGFGSFRQAIWLQYSAKHLSPAHERGYHFIFLPLVAIAYKKSPRFYTPYVRAALEKITRLRTADLRSEMQGKNPRPVIRLLRKSAEAILYAVGKLVLLTEKEK